MRTALGQLLELTARGSMSFDPALDELRTEFSAKYSAVVAGHQKKIDRLSQSLDACFRGWGNHSSRLRLAWQSDAAGGLKVSELLATSSPERGASTGTSPGSATASSGDALVATIQERGGEPVVKPNRCRKAPRLVEWHLYRERNVVEQFWSKVKQYRRVCTRYDKKTANFLAFVQVVAVMVMLK